MYIIGKWCFTSVSWNSCYVFVVFILFRAVGKRGSGVKLSNWKKTSPWKHFVLIFATHPWPTPYFQTFLQNCYGARGWLSTAVNLVKICKRLWWLLHSCINLSKLCKTTTQWNLNFRRKKNRVFSEKPIQPKLSSCVQCNVAKHFYETIKFVWNIFWNLFQEGK